MGVQLEVAGQVRRSAAYDFEALAALPEQIVDVSAVAPGRSGGAVHLSTILRAASPASDARFITIEAEEGYSACVPLDAVADHAIILYKQGNGPIPSEQGGPLRFLIPDVAACKTAEVDACANVKRLSRIVLSAERGKDTRPMTKRQHEQLHIDEAKGV